MSDRLFEHSDDSVVPNLNGILLMVLSGAAVFSMSSLFAVFSDLGVIYRLLLMAGFMLLCAIWIITIFLSGMRRYQAIVALFALGYSITVALALLLRPFGLEGLMAGFVIGHCVLLAGMWLLVVRDFVRNASSPSTLEARRPVSEPDHHRPVLLTSACGPIS